MSIKISELLSKARMVYPGGMGMYIGKTDNHIHGFGINKGKLFIPLVHPKHAYSEYLRSFFKPDSGTAEGKKSWLTQGYHETPSLRTNEVCIQRRMSFRDYYKLLMYVRNATLYSGRKDVSKGISDQLASE
jgi:hypothetical protein